MKISKDNRAYSLTFWTIFLGFILFPILALSIELGRFFLPERKSLRRWTLPPLLLPRIQLAGI